MGCWGLGRNVSNLEFNNCHIERSETSNSKIYPNGRLHGIGVQNSENLESKTACHIEQSEISKNLKSKNHNPNLTQILNPQT